MRSPCTAMNSSPCSPQLEKSPRAAMTTQHSQKIRKKKVDRYCQIASRMYQFILLVGSFVFFYINMSYDRTSLVVQWLRACLRMQGTQVRALVREDLTCHNCWVHVPQLLKPVHLGSMLRNKRNHSDEKPAHHNKEQPPLAATREGLRAATKTQCSQK